MKLPIKILSAFLVLAMMLSVCSGFYAVAAPKISSIKVVAVPSQTKFYRGVDWDYGVWDQPDDNGPWVWVSKNKISFLRNPGSGKYQERGMINAQGLVIEVKYSDGSKKQIAYKETKKSDGTYSQNIIISPENGEYKVGKMKVEVWLEADYNCYDTYEIEIVDRQKGDVNGDFRVNSVDALLVLQHSVSIKSLTAEQKQYADMNNDKKYNSSDALAILQKAVGV